jgi:hypothetical protein
VSRPARRSALIRGSALLLVLGAAVGSYVAFHGDPSGVGTGPVPLTRPSAPPPPKFDFRIASVKPLPTGKTKNIWTTAGAAAQNIRTTLNRLYITGFLDRAAWASGHYGGAWGLFTSEALPTARRDEGTLTLGAAAGRTYQAVTPNAGRLAVRVLMDRYGHPSTAVALVTFSARATQQNGRAMAVRSSGQFFLRPGARGWAIYGYQIRRDDAGLSAGAGATP